MRPARAPAAWVDVAPIVLAMPLVSVLNLREHWAKRANRARAQKFIALAAVRRALDVTGLQFAEVHVTLTRLIGKRGRRMDSDNLAASCKAGVDGVASALGIDDGDPRITWLYAQERSRDGRHSVRLDIRYRSK